jgi:3-dehydroquinate synthase
MKQDKKSVDLNINYILLKEFGHPTICKLDEKFIKLHLENFFKEVN